MNISILHLYSNLMNLYGEYANIKVLKRHLEDQGAVVTVTKADNVNDIDLGDFDFIYIASGTENNQKKALSDLLTKKFELISLAESGKIMLFTGNAFEMLGKSITSSDGNIYDGIGLLSFTVTEQNTKRYTTDVIAECSLCDEKIVGFINKASEISGIENSFCTLTMGLGNDNKAKDEGFVYKNVTGTHIIGPVLVKNPELMRYYVTLICKSKDNTFAYKDIDYKYEKQAHSVTLGKLSERLA
ncbi:MAG: hypothetical protein ACI4IS_08055 [Acutalibacteraceae bacterium]